MGVAPLRDEKRRQANRCRFDQHLLTNRETCEWAEKFSYAVQGREAVRSDDESLRRQNKMKRTGRAAASLMVTALLVTACGGSGGNKTLSEDDFVDELNSICKSADRAINRLEPDDRGFFDDVLEVMQGSADELAGLKPPADFEKDFNDFSDNLDDTIKATEDLRDAVDDGDEGAIADASDDLTKLSEDGDGLADDMGVDDCVDIGVSGGGTATTDPTTPGSTDDTTANTTDNTTANTPLPIDTTAPTAPTTPPTASTTQATVPTPMTSPSTGGTGLAEDAEGVWLAPAGWSFLPNDPSETLTPVGDPVLGPVVTGYWVGFIENGATGQQAFMYVSETTQEWTAEQVDAIWAFEAVSSGTDVTTPLGLPARIAIGLGDQGQYDVGAVILSTNSISIFTTTGGEDIASLLDAVFTANTMGG